MAYTNGAVQSPFSQHILDEPLKLRDQAINLFVGRCLGQGAYRRVYELKHAPDLVIKLEYSHDFQNTQEWLAWQELEHTPWGQWVAPCVSIDEFSGALIQKRAPDLTDEQWNALGKYPSIFADAGRRNWGWYEDRPVLRDYGLNHIMSRGLRGVRWTDK